VPLLSLVDVTLNRTRGRRRQRDRIVLCDVSLTIDPAQWVAVWGMRRSGRSTLLKAATGLLPPSAGVVTFNGVDVARGRVVGVPGGIGYGFVEFRASIATSALDHVAAPALNECSRAEAERRACSALRRVGAADRAEAAVNDLDQVDAARVAIARALVMEPALLLLDEPLAGVPPARAADSLLALIESLVREDGIAVLMTTGDAADLAGVDRALTLHGSRLQGSPTPPRAPVIPLRRDTA
jgi:energy-coupling factor transporter ATP-binding protein EcfA2